VSDPLRDLRERIDAIDGQLVDLLAERAAVAAEVIEAKIADGLPVYVPERERVKVARFREAAAVRGLDPEWAEDFQKKMTARNYTIRVVAADPPEYRRLVLRWGREQSADDREHMDNLQRRSEPFYVKLRKLGFKRVEMYIDRRQIWRKDL